MLIPNVIRPVSEWRDPRHRRGLAGELAAARYLGARRWSVVAHRYRAGRHDIDLIVRRRDLVAFVEVKTRSSAAFGDGREAVSWKKRGTVERVAAIWVARHGRPWLRYRFDVAIIWCGPTGCFPQVTHIEDAWRPVGK